MEFYRETTEGFVNKYVRNQMFSYNVTTVETFGARAVNVVQIERRRIRIGDSDTQTMDGLVPVTRPIRECQRKRRRGTRGGKSLHLGEQTGTDSEDDGNKGFLEARSQRKRRGSSPPAGIKGQSWSPPNTGRGRPARVEQGDHSRGTTMGAARRLEGAPRGEHCAPAGRRTKTPSREKLQGPPG